MSVTGVFSKGRPTGHPAATSILRYIPRPRVPWQPSKFGRANLDESDLDRLWSRGRYRNGPGNYNSGYSTEKTHVMEDSTVPMIPKKELEKYMPDISIPEGKALVTPISLMSARHGHRVTHDMLHSYDPYIGRLQKPAVVDHENISVYDPNRVGLNAATLDSRGRIYRWLRRGPFFQEDQYFRRSTMPQRNGSLPPPTVQEVPLIKKIIRLANQGKLKEACEAYRQLTSVPPVEVYRALTAACIPSAQLADAVAIFEDGNSQMFYAARDGEVLLNLMRCAVKAKHRVRVMWVWNIMCGRYYEDVLVRAEINTVWRFRISLLALTFLLDTHAGEEARTVYRYMAQEQLLNGDLHARFGQAMKSALKEGKGLQFPNLSAELGEHENGSFLTSLEWISNRDATTAATTLNGALSAPVIQAFESLALQQNARRIAPEVADAVYTDYVTQIQQIAQREEEGELGMTDLINANTSRLGENSSVARLVWSRHLAVTRPPSLPPSASSSEDPDEEAKIDEGNRANLEWLQAVFPDVAVLAILRHARFKFEHEVDLLLSDENRPAYLSRVVHWLYLLSERAAEREEKPLPYLRKSKPSMTNENVRVVPGSSGFPSSLPLLKEFGNTATPFRQRLLPSEEGYEFAYSPGLRLVQETYRYPGPRDSLRARYLALQPLHTEVPTALRLVQRARQREAKRRDELALGSECVNELAVEGGISSHQPPPLSFMDSSTSNSAPAIADAASSPTLHDSIPSLETHRDGKIAWSENNTIHASVWEYLPHSVGTASQSSGGDELHNLGRVRFPTPTGSTLLKSEVRASSASDNMDEKF